MVDIQVINPIAKITKNTAEHIQVHEIPYKRWGQWCKQNRPKKLLPNTLRRLMIFRSEIFGPKHLASPHEVCGRLEDL